MFSVGDLVVHPMHGAGVIDDIVRERVAGSTQEYYVFKMPVGGLLLKIPIAKSQLIGLRAIIGRAEAEQLISSIPEIVVDQDSNWNKRYRENLERLKSGDLYQVARVIKGLMHRDRRRGLSTGERKMLHAARQILLSELVLSVLEASADMETRVDRAMLQSPVQLRGLEWHDPIFQKDPGGPATPLCRLSCGCRQFQPYGGYQ